MEKKSKALLDSLGKLNNLESSIASDNIADQLTLATQMNSFVESLQDLFSEGRSMDDSSFFPIPLDLLEHIDHVDSNNPELYQHKLFDDCELRAKKISDKINKLEELKTNISQNIKKDT
eukprot:gene4095-5843_t